MIFAIVFPIQEAQIAAWCWGSCGKGLVGMIELGPYVAIGCREEVCPHVEKQATESCGTLEREDEPVFLRKLLPVTP
jgi:hypothetical protein